MAGCWQVARGCKEISGAKGGLGRTSLFGLCSEEARRWQTESQSGRGDQLESGAFFPLDRPVKLASDAARCLLRECALRLSPAQRSRDRPANPASLGAAVEAAHVPASRRAGAEFGLLRSPRLAAALLDLPAVRPCRHGLCPSFHTYRLAGLGPSVLRCAAAGASRASRGVRGLRARRRLPRTLRGSVRRGRVRMLPA